MPISYGEPASTFKLPAVLRDVLIVATLATSTIGP
jgi:hypothetical protein